MRKIVIAPYLLHFSLMKKYRKEDAFSDAKFFTKESFLSNYFYEYGDDALLHLVNRYSLDVDKAKQILKAVSRIQVSSSNNEKIKEILKYKDELLKEDLISRNEYFDQELKDTEIEIYLYPENDYELNLALANKNFRFIKEENELPNVVHHFHTNNEELSYVFNEIAKLIDSGVPGNKIAIYGLKETDELIFNRLVKNYKFHVNNAYVKNLLSKRYINRFLTCILDKEIESAFEIAKEEAGDDASFIEFERIVNKFKVEKLKPLFQVEIYKNQLQKVRLNSLRYEDGIEVVNTPICEEDKYLFIVNMVQGSFPKIVRDNDYLNDDDKKEAGIATTIAENSAKYEQFSNYLRQKGHIYLSYSDCSFTDKYYPSPFVSNYKIDIDNDNIQDDFYSFDEVQLSYANLLDKERNYLQRAILLSKFRKTAELLIPYRTYDYRVKNINHFGFNQVIELSYSSVKNYFECAYKYYLNKIIKVDELDSSFNLALGNLIHDVLEHIKDNESFDATYQKAYERNADQFEKYDWVLLRRLKGEIERVFNFVNEFESQVINGNFEREKPFRINLDEQIVLKGKIDKIVYSGNNEDVAIIDYKSGSEDFSQSMVKFGLSLQLPTYALFMSKLKEKARVSGLFIQSVLLETKDSFYSRVLIENLNKRYQLKGLVNADEEVFNKLDTTIDFKYLNDVSRKVDGSISNRKSYSDSDFVNLASLAEEKILEAGHDILDNNFPINPKSINDQDKSCTWCPFKDICFKDASAYIRYVNKGENDGEEATDA